MQATTVLQWPDKPILTFQSCSNPSTAAKNSRSRREVFANARIGKWRSEFPCLDSDIHNGTVPFGRRKGQRNLSTALIGMVHQTVTVKEGDKSKRMTKGEALIKVIMNKANLTTVIPQTVDTSGLAGTSKIE